jgi:hypothetical protein
MAQPPITRRGFMKGGALALVGTSAIPSFLARGVMAEVTTAASRNKSWLSCFSGARPTG